MSCARRQPGVRSAARDAARGLEGGVGERVVLALLVQLEDLGVGEMPRRVLGETLQQHGAEAEVGHHQGPQAELARAPVELLALLALEPVDSTEASRAWKRTPEFPPATM